MKTKILINTVIHINQHGYRSFEFMFGDFREYIIFKNITTSGIKNNGKYESLVCTCNQYYNYKNFLEQKLNVNI